MINTIWTLSIDAVQKANTGYPGAPMSAVVRVHTPWTGFFRRASPQPTRPNGDRFVVSAGRENMLLRCSRRSGRAV